MKRRLIDPPITLARRAKALVKDSLGHLLNQLKEVYARHLDLMNGQPRYRAQIVAGAAAIITVLRVPAIPAAILLAVLGLHAAAHGPRHTDVSPYWRDEYEDV